jgi:hypothetical protein
MATSSQKVVSEIAGIQLPHRLLFVDDDYKTTSIMMINHSGIKYNDFDESNKYYEFDNKFMLKNQLRLNCIIYHQ